ncbi:hypothetical protein MBRA1_003730 [Malassezia brasiliensis]|uniref:Uncharacterized protein n=1 Tax=Malassezia brasiliensis TaxID=1821822 RepID=A0AAF0IRD5_9BASI|nr:hypothetical protein MBRA1_003730 [Malassezia brasiliensis]
MFLLVAAVAALLVFIVSVVMMRRKRAQPQQAQQATAGRPTHSTQVWPAMTPGYGYAADQPYMTTMPMRPTSTSYANQPPPGPPPEDSYKPELFSGLPAEAPPSYVEVQAASSSVQAPEPAYPNGHRSVAHFAADGPAAVAETETGAESAAGPAAGPAAEPGPATTAPATTETVASTETTAAEAPTHAGPDAPPHATHR